MHNCKTAHPKKSHRRRNRALRRALEPLHKPEGWGSSEPGPAHEGTGIFQLKNPFSYFGAKTTGAEVSKQPFGGTRLSGQHVQVYQPSALRRLAANARRFMQFTGRRSG